MGKSDHVYSSTDRHADFPSRSKCVKLWTAYYWFCQRLAPAIKSIPLHWKSVICMFTGMWCVNCSGILILTAHRQVLVDMRSCSMLLVENRHEWLLKLEWPSMLEKILTLVINLLENLIFSCSTYIRIIFATRYFLSNQKILPLCTCIEEDPTLRS